MNRIAIYGAVRSPAEHAAWIETLRDDFAGDKDMERVIAQLETRGCIPMQVAVMKQEQFDLAGFIPSKWEGQFKEHRVSARAIIDDTAKEIPFTHVALFVGPFEKETRFPLYFGRHVIKAQFALCGWSPEKQHVLFHCPNCATAVSEWIAEQQHTWRDALLPPPPKEPTNVAPSGLQ